MSSLSRKTVRATLVLLPLFGLHFVVTAYRPKGGGTCEWIELYFYADYLLDGMQGFLVALIFCYFNGEVHYLMKRSYLRFVESRNPSRRGGRSWLSVGLRNGSSVWENRTRASTVHSTMVSSSLVEGVRRDSAQEKGESIKNGDTIL
ncbi:hypothetical protein J437_LFUL002410 [Ladona fulva]|uniref:G-protein coupled receptors family 2 profile 2 domain-containing protein n=1 Tax=Ladona fulva TaxID=123851 RepID=A0A8K0P971_LADFU|nr:hypothetical protein J437_LFUL002410 [Ladona fulva]